ncbi:transcriptional regulator, TetR family [Actinomyces ruminicola]|uniref:Transcriptional regulator, TetR family n=1 Tax=Actinomyces ruminicola TaxID=332524 RepID=A0A1H0DV82_9ACTO|nr:TetR family transcriptional regulator [Actinomyces ruminicola]SDN73891.1 transcriptional regulator, TetR family [Actinomyces ruminicola]
MRRTAAEAAETRKAIISSALHRFAQDGWEACSLVEVARGADVTRGAIYHHFTGKRDLLDAVLSEHWRRQGEALFAVLDASAPPEKRLTMLLADYLRRLSEDTAFRELAVVTVVVAPQAPALKSGLEQKTAVLAQWSERVARLLPECEPQLRAPLDVARFSITAFLHGATLTAALTPGDLPEPKCCWATAHALVAGLIAVETA